MKKQYRMYSIVLRHLSGIQKGIQHGHAKDMYEKDFGHLEEYKDWLNNSVTVVVLECHSTQQLRDAKTLLDLGQVYNAMFFEPDLDNIPTAISFLAEEEVWDWETYPHEVYEIYTPNGLSPKEMRALKENAQIAANITKYGSKIGFLRDFHRKYNLASN